MRPRVPSPEIVLPDPSAITLRHFEAFVAVADERSFSRAAGRLRLAQPTVSGHVAALERLLGVRLLDREPVPAPTPAGRALLHRAREALRARERGIFETLAAAGTVAGDLGIAGSNIPSAYLLPPRIATFLARHPKVTVRLWTGDSSEAIERVRAGESEVGAVGKKPLDGGLAATVFAEDRVVLVAPRDHPFAARRGIRPADLRGRAFVVREAGSGTAAAAASALRGVGLDPERDLKVAYEAASTEALREAVAAGIGLAFLSDRAVARGDGRLRPVRVRGLEIRRSFYLVHAAHRTLSPAAREFLSIAGSPPAGGAP